MKKIVLIIVCSLFIGCSYTPKTTQLKSLHAGLSQKEVIQNFGEEPTGIHFVDGHYVLHYLLYTPDTHMQDYYFTFNNDQLVGWEGRHRPRGTSPGGVLISIPMVSGK